jgi:hypothetical protein
MPVSPVIANTVQVRLLWVLSGQGAMNVLHAIKVGSVTVNQALADTLGVAIKSAFVSNLGTQMNTSVGLVRVGVRDLSTANQAEFLDSNATSAGTGLGDSLPQQTAVCVTLRTALSGKSFRGRVYLGGFSEAENDPGGNSLQAVSTASVAFMTAVSNALIASSMNLAVASRPAEAYTITKFTQHSDGTTSTDTIGRGAARAGQSNRVTSLSVRDLRWESQRRRSNGRGAAPSLLTPSASAILFP